jgi:hypothetical protein
LEIDSKIGQSEAALPNLLFNNGLRPAQWSLPDDAWLPPELMLASTMKQPSSNN